MRLISRQIDPKSHEGAVKLEAQDAEDLWHVYNLIAEDDTVTASTIRKVTSETDTGSTTADRKRMTLSISVRSVNFDATIPEIRVGGAVVNGNKFVRNGAFHTLELEPHRAFTISKEHWDTVCRDRLDLALDPAADADLGALLLEEGLAHVLLVTRSMTLTRARVEQNIPRKGKNAIFNRSSAMEKFFSTVLKTMMRHLDFATLKVIIIASPGFVKDEFFKYMMLEAARHDFRELLENKQKVVLTHSSSGQKHAFSEIIQRPALRSRLSQTGAAAEVIAWDKFLDMLRVDPDRAPYGPAQVKYALDMAAVDTMMVTDKLFRSNETSTRKKYVELVDKAKSCGAKIQIFSTQHGTGEKLDKMSGIAAILRFPLPGLDDIDPSDGI